MVKCLYPRNSPSNVGHYFNWQKVLLITGEFAGSIPAWPTSMLEWRNSADASDLKSDVGNSVRVQFPSLAPYKK